MNMSDNDSCQNSYASNSNPYRLLSNRSNSSIINMYFQINHLKQLFRRGYLLNNRVPVDKCESVADHCYGMLVLAWLLMDNMSLDLDMTKIFKLILVHEFGEIYGGDIIPSDNISSKEKMCIEDSSIHQLIDGTQWEESCLSIWNEHCAQETPESRFVSQLDKLEMCFQTAIYQMQYKQDFTDILAGQGNFIYDAELSRLLREIQSIAGTEIKSVE